MNTEALQAMQTCHKATATDPAKNTVITPELHGFIEENNMVGTTYNLQIQE